MIYKMVEWEGSSGIWYCNDVSNLAGGSGNWWNAARAWNLTPADFIKLLITKYKPDIFSYSMDKNVLIYGWKNQNNMRVIKNACNAQARKNNFQIQTLYLLFMGYQGFDY